MSNAVHTMAGMRRSPANTKTAAESPPTTKRAITRSAKARTRRRRLKVHGVRDFFLGTDSLADMTCLRSEPTRNARNWERLGRRPLLETLDSAERHLPFGTRSHAGASLHASPRSVPRSW